MYFKHGRTQEGAWLQDDGVDDSFVDFSTARIGCWVSDQKKFDLSSSSTEIEFNNVEFTRDDILRLGF